MSRTRLALFPLPALAATLLVLAGCGGGGGDDNSAPPPPAGTTVTIAGVAADGPLQGATACYDLDDNDACNGTEPRGPTDAGGRFSFEVATAVAGLHRVVVDVPATAVDRDTGAAVGFAFTLVAPATGSASQAVFASPLTTLVQKHMDNTGASLAEAAAFIQSQAGLAVSPLADFTAATNAGNTRAGHVARLVVLTTKKQSDAVASIVGTVDLSGTTITPADVTKAVDAAIVTALPGIAAAAAEPAVAGASGAALQTALAAAADAIVAGNGVTAPELATTIGVRRLPADAAASTATAGATLSAFRYASADNWLTRTLESSAADATPDAAGKLRYYSVYKQSESSNFSPNGVVYAWATGNTRDRAGDLHWNGSGWVSCQLGERNESSQRDAQGRSSYEFCKKREEGASRRAAVDLNGKKIADVFRDTIRTFPGGANGVDFANWGPTDPATFGNATFPAGAKLYYQTNTVLKSAPAYDVQPGNAVSAYSAAVAAGGDARSATPACSTVTAANDASLRSQVTSLEDLVARNPGVPCRFNPGTNSDGLSGPTNDWWSNSTVSIGTLANSQVLPAGTANYYTTSGYLRVAFAATGNAATFLHCLQRRTGGSVRNCSVVGTGTYAIQTLGDARVMTFSAQPALNQRLTYTRVFVERGGKVWFGYTSKLGDTASIRLNLEATNAVFAPLGIAPIRPVARASDFSAATAAALATAKGAFGTATATDAIVIRFGDGGRFLLGEAAPANAVQREQTGGELGWFDLDTTTGKYASLLEVDSNLTSGTSHPGPSDTLTISATQIVTNNGTVFPRLPGGTTGIVGLWALGSATDLSVGHFAFFSNGKVLHIDSVGTEVGGVCAIDRQGPPGAEFASYTFNAATGALRFFGKIYDTNGCAGIFDSSTQAVMNGFANTETNVVVTFSADGKTATVAETGEPTVTIYRIPSQ